MFALTREERAVLQAWRDTVGSNLSAQRRRQRMSLEKCARLTGLDPRTIDTCEMGKGRMFLPALVKLASVLDVPLASILENMDE